MLMASVLALLIFLISGVDSIQENAGVSSKGKVCIKGGQTKKMARKGHGYVCIFLAAINYVVLEVIFFFFCFPDTSLGSKFVSILKLFCFCCVIT